jgi:hypothetical protein
LYKLDVGDQQLGDKHVLWNAVGEMKKWVLLCLVIVLKFMVHMYVLCDKYKI